MTGRVAVIGAGLSGLTAACELAERGALVTLLESRRQVGGATFSFHRNGFPVDNGQHVLLRCYARYRALLSRLGTASAVDYQRRFAVPVLTPELDTVWLRRTDLPAPLHLAAGLAGYRALSWPDRVRAAWAAAALRGLDDTDPALDERTFGDWLARHGQNSRTLTALWDLITVPALNCPAAEASLSLSAMVFRTALLTRADAADIGVPSVPLTDLHCAPAEKYLRDHGADVRTGTAVRAIEPVGGGFTVHAGDEPVHADAVVLAVPPAAAARLCPETAAPQRESWTGLGSAPILNLHVIYPVPVTRLPFVAVLDSPVQWVFDRTAAAGLDTGQYLTVSVSAAQQWIDERTEPLRARFLPELARLFPLADKQEPVDFFVTRERRATFRQVPGTRRLRPDAVTGLPGLVLAGAWTATGWPDTMEGAVRSGERAAELTGRYLAGSAL